MVIKHDSAEPPPLYRVTEVTGHEDLGSRASSYKVKESTPILDLLHREIPVHVTQQVAGAVDAERPPSNRRRANQPPGDGWAKQPGDNNLNHPFGNGNGGDKDKGDGSGGDGNGPSILLKLGNSTPNVPAKWRWDCSNCGFLNLYYNYDTACPGCGAWRNGDCRVWAVA
ncbi:hypothetical protein F4801DRAFT_231395 [Xylaria longipes]|nr:hypothetical protein F4801DRAFT_231395 [Xylaria longipes]